MTVKEVYEKVCYRTGEAVDERKFINFLEDTLSELCVIVPEKYLWLNTGCEKHPSAISDEEIWCNDLFCIAIVENICYLATGDENKKSLFYKYAENAGERTREMQDRGRVRIMPKR